MKFVGVTSPFVQLIISTSFFEARIASTTFEDFNDAVIMDAYNSKLPYCPYSENDNGDVCRTAFYLHQLKQMFDEALRIPDDATAPVPDIEIVDGQYDKIFLNYIIQRRPFKVAVEAALNIYRNFSSLCAYDNSGNQVSILPGGTSSIERPLLSCPLAEAIGKDLLLPKLTRNCYLNRLNWTFDYVNSRRKEFDNFNYEQWPTVLILKNRVPTSVRRCPRNMHMVLWGSSTQTRIRIFQSSSAHYFDPYIEDVDGIPVMQFSGTGFPKLESQDNRNGDSKSLKRFPQFSEATLEKGKGYIFVPHDYLVSFVAEGESMDDAAAAREDMDMLAPPSLLQYCFVDASNYNAFREELLRSSKWSDLDNSLLMKLQSNSFEKKMYRDVEEVTLDMHINGGEVSEAGIANDELPTDSKAPVKSSRRVRGPQTGTGSTGSTFREWQETNKWNHIITSLTLPRPSTPIIHFTGRKNVTTTITSSFLPTKLDSTRFGFNLTVCEAVMSTGNIFAKPGSALTGTECHTVAVERPSADLLEDINIEESARQGFEVVRFTYTLAGLKPGSEYRLRSTIFYGESESTSSDWTDVFVTKEITVPFGIPAPRAVCSLATAPKKKRQCRHEDTLTALPSDGPNSIELVFATPEDDGGDAITGYDVWRRCAAREFCSTSWRLVGTYESSVDEGKRGFQTIKLNDLLPGIGYIFSLAARNNYGSSTISHPSNDASTNFTSISSRKEPFYLYGRGINQYGMSRPGNGSTAEGSVTNSRSLVVTLDDHAQTLQFSRENGEVVSLSGWASHRSPHLFLVQGELVLANPPLIDDEEGMLQNTDEIFGRIVVVLRGVVPIVHKLRTVQYYGAIGCVVIDDGRCSDYSQRCLPGADKKHGEGWGKHDLAEPWERINIPTIFFLASEAQPLMSALGQSQPEETLPRFGISGSKHEEL